MLRVVVPLLLLSIIGAVVIVGKTILTDSPSMSTEVQVIRSECQLEHSVCELELVENKALRFELTPGGLPAMQTLLLRISDVNEVIRERDKVKIWFEGRDMNMGQHYMLPLPEDAARGIDLSYTGMIPVCTVDEKMVWRLMVELPTERGRQQIQFELK